VTGFGLGGHLLEMARASHASVEIHLHTVPFLDKAVELAGLGLMPAGSFANKKFCTSLVAVDSSADPLLADLAFDAQTSGGLILAVPEDKLDRALDLLAPAHCLAADIGRVVPCSHDIPRLHILP
jgi:selenide,water dikinase